MIDFGPTSHTFFSQRLQLRYVDWGNPSAPPLLLVHGGRDHCRSWDWVAQELRHNYHIIAPDLRGHGDSAWSPDGDYSMLSYVYDLAQLIHQLKLAPVTIISHSLGANISTRYTGLYPDAVKKLVSIEGLGSTPAQNKEKLSRPVHERWGKWIADRRASSGRLPKKYPSLETALARMQEENKFLSAEQAHHLTKHGIIQNEDGTYSWKFDNYLRQWPPLDISFDEQKSIWQRIICPVLYCLGKDSWATDPREDGRAQYFTGTDLQVKTYENAGHWLHHDQFKAFMNDLDFFL